MLILGEKGTMKIGFADDFYLVKLSSIEDYRHVESRRSLPSRAKMEVFIYREANFCADALTNLACQGAHSIVYEQCPSIYQKIIITLWYSSRISCS